MNNWDARDEPELGGCTLDADFGSAARAAKHIGIPLHRVNLTKEYWSKVFQPTLAAYGTGTETPNPDVACNKEIKFGELMRWATREQIDALATGHYAQIYPHEMPGSCRPGVCVLQQARDLNKDQTYFLSQSPQDALRDALFPVGGLLKAQVRDIAAGLGMDWLLKRPESMGICFVGTASKRRFSRALQAYLPAQRPGPIADLETGQVIGEHQGLSTLTIGQNARLASMPSRMYVAQKDASANTIYLVNSINHPSLNPRRIKIRGLAWYTEPTGRMFVSVRSQDKVGVPVGSVSAGSIELESSVFAPASGQYAVLYEEVPGQDRRLLVGSATITK
jgi:tRNA-specific 2-thiouridylase